MGVAGQRHRQRRAVHPADADSAATDPSAAEHRCWAGATRHPSVWQQRHLHANCWYDVLHHRMRRWRWGRFRVQRGQQQYLRRRRRRQRRLLAQTGHRRPDRRVPNCHHRRGRGAKRRRCRRDGWRYYQRGFAVHRQRGRRSRKYRLRRRRWPGRDWRFHVCRGPWRRRFQCLWIWQWMDLGKRRLQPFRWRRTGGSYNC